jgi:hypothetical protein
MSETDTAPGLPLRTDMDASLLDAARDALAAYEAALSAAGDAHTAARVALQGAGLSLPLRAPMLAEAHLSARRAIEGIPSFEQWARPTQRKVRLDDGGVHTFNTDFVQQLVRDGKVAEFVDDLPPEPAAAKVRREGKPVYAW